MRAEAAGDPGPWRQQAILGRGDWNADALRDIVREYALETLADDDAVLVIDETGFLKQGKASCGVARQYTGSAGKITNCQIGVFAAYVSRHGHAFIDRALYLPKEWTDDPERLKAAHVPRRGRLCHQTPDRAQNDRPRHRREGAIRLGCGGHRVWHGRYRDHAAQCGQRLCAGRRSQSRVPFLGQEAVRRGTAADIAQSLPKRAWRRLSAGEGTKGPRLHDWAYLELADLDAGEYSDTLTGPWTRGLLIRRSIADPADLAFFSTWCPKGTTMTKLVAIEGHRWAIEDSFETAKNEFGLDHNESRSWHGWHRHVSLVMLAFAMMAIIRHHANAVPLKKTLPRLRTNHPLYPLVDPGNPPHRHKARPTTHPTRHIIAWSLWRRAHQAEARRAHFKRKSNCNVILFDCLPNHGGPWI